MSRLIIKNLPTFATPDTLRKHFSQTAGPGGNITDVKVSNRPDGTSRRFGFVGFKTQEEAQKAKQWFDRTFIGGAKISVDFSEGAKDAPAPRPNKKRRVDSEPKASSSLNSIPQNADAGPSPKKDSKLEEFMNVMKPKRGPAWANDEVTSQPILPQASTSTGPSTADRPALEDEEQRQEISAEQGELSDMEWLRRRMTQKVADDVPEEKVFEQSDNEEDPPSGQLAKMEVDDTPKQPELPKDPTMETILQTGRLFLRNLAFSCTKEELQELFDRFGTISQIHIPVDPSTNQPKGMAYVAFAEATSALAAYKTLDKTSFQGRLVHILGAVDRRGFEVVEGEGKKSLRDERADKKKKAASKEFNWSMLYMNSDAVASSIADRMGIPKAEILNSETGSNAAVKLALAETHIIQETKLYLESQGVDLASFGTLAGSVDGGPVHHPKRSDTTILVKNIPYGTTSEQVEELFQSYGNLVRVLVPPAGTIAIVEFEKADEARKGFRGVAYRRLGNSVIYLEKGPVGMWLEGFDVEKARAVVGSASTSSTLPVVRVDGDASSDEDKDEATGDQSVQGGSTLYVKNLSFNTTQERLSKVFAHLPSFSFARIQTKPDPKNTAARLSMGYGFIGFKDKDSARKALKSVHGFVLDGHALSVSFAGRGADESSAAKDDDGVTSSKSRTTKMLVKNVPFEATKNDIRDLFSAHGQLKSVRLPKKFDARSRGFAFLDFVSRREAENAFNALRHTHLLGRHLVLEWAEEGEQDLEVLRKKAGAGFSTAKDMPGKKRKLEFMQKADDGDAEPLEEY